MKGEGIVNAANATLPGGGGVDGTIHRAAGPGLLEERRRLGGRLTGEARITGGHNLPARYVIRTVCPAWTGGGHREDALLAACYCNSPVLATQHGIKDIALPFIITGAYGLPQAGAAGIAIREASDRLRQDAQREMVFHIWLSRHAPRRAVLRHLPAH
jgi:O-acetyl-ADP-ribose deacetylase (regulator of RNase III)